MKKKYDGTAGEGGADIKVFGVSPKLLIPQSVLLPPLPLPGNPATIAKTKLNSSKAPQLFSTWRIPQSHPPINPLIYTTRRSPLSQNLGDIILWHHLIPIDSLVLQKQCATSCLLSMLFKEYTWEPFLLWFSLISENRNWYSDIEECAYLCKAWRQQSCCWGRRRREGPSLNDSHRLLPLLVH